MKVADVMSKHVEFVTPDTKIKNVALLIFGRGINGVPVLKGKKIVGFIGEHGILSQFYPSLAEFAEDPFREGNFEDMEEKVNEILELPVSKIMKTNIITVSPNMPLLKAQSLMFVNKVGRLPVVDSKKNLVGIIAQGDIFRSAVGDKLLFTEDEEYNDWLSKTYYATVDIKGRLSHEIPDLLKVFEKQKVKSVIDIGSGTGDHAIDFARRGYEVVGLDRSLEMVKEAKRRRSVLSLEASRKLLFLHGGFDELEGRFTRPFDAALIMGNTLSHNPHNVTRVLKDTTKLLRDDGVLVLQITNFDKVINTANRLLNFNFAVPEGENREHAFLEFYDKPNLKERTILKTFAILTNDGGKRWKSSGVRNSLMAYTNKTIIRDTLKKLGYKKIDFYGGSFDGKNWDYLFRKEFKPHESDWLNVLAIK